MNVTPTLVLIRPEAQSLALLSAVESDLGRSVPAVVSPVLRIRSTGAAPDLARFNAVILTSANGVRMAPDLTGKRAYCVGSKTALLAQRRGAEVARIATDADTLVTDLLTEVPAGPLVHLAGTERRGDIADRLSTAGIETEIVETYEAAPVPLSDAALAVLQGNAPAVLPLFSPRSAEVAGAGLTPGPHLSVIAISAAVAVAWQKTTGGPADICTIPIGDEMRRRTVAALRG